MQYLLRLPARIRQEDGTRDDFESVFQAIDADGDGSITKQEFRESVMKLKAQAQQTSAPGAEEKEEI